MRENWNLSDIYADQEEALKVLDEVRKKCEDFNGYWVGKISDRMAEPARFKDILNLYAKLVGEICKLSSYAYLLHSTYLNNEKVSAFYQNVNDGLSECEKLLIFFKTEIQNASKLDLKMDMLKYHLPAGDFSWLEKCLQFKPYTLDNAKESIFADYDGQEEYWIRLYDQTRAGMRFEFAGMTYTEGGLQKLLANSDANIRHGAGERLEREYQKNRDLFSLIYNALLRQRQIYSDWHHYRYSGHASNISNKIEAEDLKGLVDTCASLQNDIAQRYYRLKAKAFGVNKLSYWDRNAPYPLAQDNKTYTIEEAKEIILSAFHEFSPRFASLANHYFEMNLIDYYPRKGKDTGAYCMEMPVNCWSRVFLNYNGKIGDVITMAHELGHAIHEHLSKTQGELGRDKSCAQAETASIFAEFLVFKKLLEKQKNPQKRFMLLASHMEDLINTSFRQIAFHNFEYKVSEARRKGELSADMFEQVWLEEMGAYLGDAVDVESIKSYWCSVPHFFHYSFYVYSYCFSSCVVNTLIDVYDKGQISDFADKYMKMLEQGGVEDYREALSKFGIDAGSSDYWAQGFALTARYIDELEELYKEVFEN